MALKNSLRPRFRKKHWLVVFALFLGILVLGVLELTNTTYFLHNKKVPQVIPATTSETASSQEQKKDPSKVSSGNNSKNTSDKTPSSTGGTSGGDLNLIQPYGSLVSNHFPGQNGSDTKEQSVCNTTSGAICYIQFTHTSSGKITKLPEQTVNSNGTASWSWDAKTLTPGKWQIEAFASLNGQAKSVTDSIGLDIQ
jgi:hypothetical protein